CYRDTWQTTLADQGYQSTSIEFSMPKEKFETGDGYIRHFVKILKKSIETDHSFYPPILIAHGLHALVAQRYVESNPVSALVLVSPFIPEVIPGRFQKLSHKLLVAPKDTVNATTAEAAMTEEPTITDEKQEKTLDAGKDTNSPTSAAEETPLPYIAFETHADVLAQEGFREKYVLPAKAVYKADRVAKELQEKEIKREKEQKEKEVLVTKEEAATQKKEQKVKNATTGEASESSKEAAEALGKDSVPVWESSPSSAEDAAAIDNAAMAAQGDALPVQTVESEASIPSPLEQLPLSIYKSIPTSVFEPTFPILLVTSNADEIVSTADVKEHHSLASQVDHIELEDLDDGGHLIMVSDNAEWEQGIQGITAWLDSNGM
ncbi:hypothetical protein BGZ83_006184, partial [Gryganskiella cystojenkinii]